MCHIPMLVGHGWKHQAAKDKYLRSGMTQAQGSPVCSLALAWKQRRFTVTPLSGRRNSQTRLQARWAAVVSVCVLVGFLS